MATMVDYIRKHTLTLVGFGTTFGYLFWYGM